MQGYVIGLTTHKVDVYYRYLLDRCGYMYTSVSKAFSHTPRLIDFQQLYHPCMLGTFYMKGIPVYASLMIRVGNIVFSPAWGIHLAVLAVAHLYKLVDTVQKVDFVSPPFDEYGNWCFCVYLCII